MLVDGRSDADVKVAVGRFVKQVLDADDTSRLLEVDQTRYTTRK